jgi:hypothetical protein
MQSAIFACLYILCDGDRIEFFRFNGSTNPPSLHHGQTVGLRIRLRLSDPGTRPFIDALRPICGTIFDLEAIKTALRRTAQEGKPGQSLEKCDRAISSAHQALEFFREAETNRQMQLVNAANTKRFDTQSLERSHVFLTSTRIASDYALFVIPE